MAGKVKYNDLSEEERKKYLGEFYSMVALLKGRDEVKNFFKDLLTLSEVVMISRRIQIAKMLLEGYKPEEIKKKLKIGYATISYVERWLNEGFGGYKQIIKKYDSKYKDKSDFEKYENTPFSKGWTRKKYSGYYMLSNLIKGKIKF